jgi:hypothetical protein
MKLSNNRGFQVEGFIIANSKKIRWAGVVLLALLFGPSSQSQEAKRAHEWDSWKFLIGRWVGEGGGGPGQGSGWFSFQPDLQGATLIRKNHSEYPATKERGAYSHDDLMVMYADPGTGQTRAFYVDSEGHVIHYVATASADGTNFTFLSEANSSAPRYRLTYVKTQADALRLTFEIAPPGKPEQFEKYIEATAHRAAESK